MATRKYKKQRKGNLKKKSLGKKKRSMKKRGKSLKKRGGNGDLIPNPSRLIIGNQIRYSILPWAKYVNPLYSNSAGDTETIKLLDSIYKPSKNTVLTYSIMHGFSTASNKLPPCRSYLNRWRDTDNLTDKEIKCEKRKIVIYMDIVKQLLNILENYNSFITNNATYSLYRAKIYKDGVVRYSHGNPYDKDAIEKLITKIFNKAEKHYKTLRLNNVDTSIMCDQSLRQIVADQIYRCKVQEIDCPTNFCTDVSSPPPSSTDEE